MPVREQLVRVFREPLAHFLIVGLAIFLLLGWRGETVDPASRTIEIDEMQVRQLAERFAQSWRRAPTPAELDGLIRDHIKEEVYYREALRLGLEEDDTIIRRRLRSKMEYLARAEAENAVADDAVLHRWLDTNAARYASGARFSFDQIFLGSGPNVAANVRAALAAGKDWQRLGEPISLPATLNDGDSAEVARIFGAQFAATLASIESGANWAGPIESGFGLHLVRVRSKTMGRVPPLSDIRQRVENDWRAETAKAREAKAYQTLLDGYDIRIAKP